MANVALITIHGMGDTHPHYEHELREALRNKMGEQFDSVDLLPVYYSKILQDNQSEVWAKVSTQAKVRFDALRKWVLFGIGDAAGLETRKEVDGSVYELAQEEIAKSLLKARENSGNNVPIVFITHSLGCQVLSNFIYDAQQAAVGMTVGAGIWKNTGHNTGRFIDGLTADELLFLQCKNATTWISTGCNIPIFVAAHKVMHIKPIRKEMLNDKFKWINIYDPDDVLGWPLQPLSIGYHDLVEDRAINAGHGVANFLFKSWNPLSHTTYWNDADVVKPLVEALTTVNHPAMQPAAVVE